MADKIEVIFGAQVAGLVAGVKEVEQAIKSLTAPIEELKTSFAKIGELTGIAFGVEKLREWVVEAAEAGEHAVNLGAALNLTAEAANNLSGMMSIVGANADTAIRLFGQLSRAVDEAITTPGSRRGFAFLEAGIDAEKLREVLSGPNGVINAINLLGDAYDRLKARGGDTGVAGPLGVILGTRTFAEIDKLISRGREFRDALKEMWAATAPPSEEGLKTLDELAERFHLLTAATENLGKAITEGLAGPLGSFLEWSTKLLANVTGIVRGIQRGPGDIYSGGGGMYGEPGGVQENIRAWLQSRGYSENAIAAILGNVQQESSFNPAAVTGSHFGLFQWDKERGAALGGSTDVATQMELMDRELQKLDPAFKTAAGSVEDLTRRFEAVFERSGAQDIEKRIGYAQTAAAGGGGPNLFEQFTKAKSEYEALQKSIEEGGAREVAEVEQQIAMAKARGATIEEEKKLYADLDAAKQRMYADEDRAAQAFKAQWGNATDEVLKKYKDHDAQKLQADTAFINQSSALNRQQVTAQIELKNTDIKLLNEQEAEDLKQVNRRLQLHDITLKDAAAMEHNIVEEHRKAVDQILQDEQRLAIAIPALREKLAAQVVESDNKAKVEQSDISNRYYQRERKQYEQMAQTLGGGLAPALTGIITGRESAGQAFAKMGQDILQKVMDNVIQKLIVQTITNLLQQLASDVANTSILAFLLSAILAKPSFAGTTFGMGGIVPSAAGGWVIPSFQSGGVLAQLHSGEMVLPRDLSEGMQGMIRGGGAGATNIHISAIDTQSGAAFLMANKNSIAQSWRSAGLYSGLSARAISSGGRYP